MRLSPLDLGVTAALVGSFAAVGEVVLRRRSRDLFSWNESYLVGAGACAGALFPLSILSPHGALRVIFWGLALALTWILVRELRERARTPSAGTPDRLADLRRDPISLALLTAIVLVAAVSMALTLRYTHFWDGFQIWATKAQLLYFKGGLDREWFPEDSYDSRILAYPPFVPLQEALLSVGRGGFDFDAVKPVFLPLYASMLLSTFAGACVAGSRRAALAVTLVLALLPVVSGGTAMGGYADMPQAAFVAGAVAASLRTDPSAFTWSRPLPWLIGALTTVKSEGFLLAGVACLGVLLFWWMEGPRRVVERALASWRGVAIVGAFLAIRIAYVRWLGLHDITYGPLDAAHFEHARTISGTVLRSCLHVLADPAEWGLFWPAFLAAGVVLAIRGTNREKCVAFATAVALAVDTAIFLFTNWEPALQISQAYPRLLLQLAPAAAVVIAAGYVRARRLSSTTSA